MEKELNIMINKINLNLWSEFDYDNINGLLSKINGSLYSYLSKSLVNQVQDELDDDLCEVTYIETN